MSLASHKAATSELQSRGGMRTEGTRTSGHGGIGIRRSKITENEGGDREEGRREVSQYRRANWANHGPLRAPAYQLLSDSEYTTSRLDVKQTCRWPPATLVSLTLARVRIRRSEAAKGAGQPTFVVNDMCGN